MLCKHLERSRTCKSGMSGAATTDDHDARMKQRMTIAKRHLARASELIAEHEMEEQGQARPTKKHVATPMPKRRKCRSRNRNRGVETPVAAFSLRDLGEHMRGHAKGPMTRAQTALPGTPMPKYGSKKRAHHEEKRSHAKLTFCLRNGRPVKPKYGWDSVTNDEYMGHAALY